MYAQAKWPWSSRILQVFHSRCGPVLHLNRGVAVAVIGRGRGREIETAKHVKIVSMHK